MPETIKLIITNTSTFVQGKLESIVYKDLKKTLGYISEDFAFKAKNSNNPHWDGVETTVCYSRTHCRCAVKKDGTHFPTGLFNKAKDVLTKHNVPFEIFDKRVMPQKTLKLEMTKDFQMRDYQLEGAVKPALQRQRGVIQASTGSGKTSIAAKIIAELGIAPFIFYVTSNDLLQQAKDELERFIIQDGKPLEVGVIGGGKCDIKDINVMTVQTAVRACGQEYIKYDEDENSEDKEELTKLEEKRQDILALIMSAKGIIADECQHWAAETCQVVSDYSDSARYRFFLSATPYRDKNDDILIEACCGRTICSISASYLIKRGFLVKPTIYFVKIDEGMPKDVYNYASCYKQGIVENEYRNKYIANLAKMFKEQGRNILILCKSIAHGKILEEMIEGSFFLYGHHSAKERLAHLEKMRTHECGITLASIIFDEGISISSLDTLILAGSGKSMTRALQRIGRTLRTYTYKNGKKKEEAIIVDFEDHGQYLLKHSKKRMKIYKSEPEFVVKYLN